MMMHHEHRQTQQLIASTASRSRRRGTSHTARVRVCTEIFQARPARAHNASLAREVLPSEAYIKSIKHAIRCLETLAQN